MGNNQEPKDIDHENAIKSMGGRMDADPAPTPKENETPEPKAPENQTPPANPTPEAKKDITPENPNPENPNPAQDNKTPVNRGERFIPMKKWHDRETEHESEVGVLKKKITDLEIINSQNPGVKKDEDIEAFMAKTGFDRDTVEGLLELAEKRVLTPELKNAIKKAETIVKEAEIDTSFSSEFSKDGEPALKTYFPEITAEKLEKAKIFLDQIAHTKEFHDKTLDYIVFKNKGEIEKLFGGEGDPNPTPPQDKKTIEPNRMGNGKPTGFTAKDFVGQKDFSSLNGMDQSARNELIKGFDDKTYDNFAAWVASQDTSLEVMRDGQRIKLK